MEQIHINDKGVLNLLNSLNPHKACGPDNINSRVIKDLKDQVAPILTKIYATSIETGTIPKDWKHANVASAFKKGERYKAENDLPISLTCICCKLMEHIITSNIMKHLDSNNILYDLQHGFRKARSCESQLLQFIQELNANNNKNIQTDLDYYGFCQSIR